MKYVEKFFFVVTFFIFVVICSFTPSLADVIVPDKLMRKYIQDKPYSDKIEISARLGFPPVIFINPDNPYNNKSVEIYHFLSDETRKCFVGIVVPGPCDYKYIAYDKDNNVVIEEKGSDEKFGNHIIRSEKYFLLPEPGNLQSVSYKIELDVTLYNYEKVKKVTGIPSYRYVIVDKNGKKLTGIYNETLHIREGKYFNDKYNSDISNQKQKK